MAIKYIQTLTRKEREYEQELVMLSTKNVESQKRVKKLKDDLNHMGHNVDDWLNDCSVDDVDHSTSTRTASEAELHRTFDEDEAEQQQQEQSNRTNNSTSNSLDNNSLEDNSCQPPSAMLLKQQHQQKSIINLLNRSLPVLLSSTKCEPTPIVDYNKTKSHRLNLDEQTSPPINRNNMTSKISPPTRTTTTDIRYDIIDLFTKGATTPQTQTPVQSLSSQVSPLPSIASLMRSSMQQNSPGGGGGGCSPVSSSAASSPVQKHTIGINTDNNYVTPSTNILQQQQQQQIVTVSQLRSASPPPPTKQSLILTTT